MTKPCEQLAKIIAKYEKAMADDLCRMVERGSSVENLKWAPVRLKQYPFFRIGRQWEINAIKDFFKLLPKNAWEKGIIGPKKYLSHRNKVFAKSKWVIQTRSFVVRIEDAREAIILGVYLGIKKKILHFI